ncbi:MAG: hypothetical protein LBV79_05605 [Candidatus Adiutrix sp.]|jgi:hypothetical protein|nr:hypothetical protein [Candidatus Adiutrix sp.]
MNDPLIYDLTEQVERLAAAVENLGDIMKPEPDDEPRGLETADPPKTAYLSLFLESLPAWQYNALRRKLLPASLAAKVLGISTAQLTTLARHGRIRGKGGRYDLMSLLMWLDADANPDTEACHAH